MATDLIINKQDRSNKITQRFDIGSVIYVGEAISGSAESDPYWTITKYDLTSLGSASGKIKINGIWTNRATETYV